MFKLSAGSQRLSGSNEDNDKFMKFSF